MDALPAIYASRANVAARPAGREVEIVSPFSADLVVRTSAERPLIVATRTVSGPNLHYSRILSNKNPQMAPWFRLGASLLAHGTEAKPGAAP